MGMTRVVEHFVTNNNSYRYSSFSFLVKLTNLS